MGLGRLGLSFPETALLNAFLPGKALDDPSLFAGRRDQVIDLAQSLHEVGACPIIYGARGLGKSSLAFQAKRIAMGDVTLLEDYGERRWAIGEDDTYLTFYVPCSESTGGTQGILQKVINSFSSITINESPGASQLVDETTMRQITLKPLFQLGIQRRFQVPDTTPAYGNLGAC